MDSTFELDMKIGDNSKNPFLLLALIAAVGLILAGRVRAQTFTTLHSFAYASDGAFPSAGLTLSGNTLYGTTFQGGSSGAGTVFKLNTDGTGFTNVYSFGGSGVILSGNTLYGSASDTVFAVNTDGTGFTNLYRFTVTSGQLSTNSDGATPGPLILSGNTLYGTAESGGSAGNGTVFAVNTDGTGFTNLHSFGNSDGVGPRAGLILSGNTLYGTAYYGGSSGNGTVFAVNTDGTGFVNLHDFGGYASDGGNPQAGLILSGQTLYGTTYWGGSTNAGTVFALNTDGTGFTNLYSFTSFGDEAHPFSGLILSDNTLYGTTEGVNIDHSFNGTVCKLNTDGTGFKNLHTFNFVSDGGTPRGGLILSGNTLYGTAYYGGAGSGTVFSLSFRPQLTINHSGTNVVLTWLTNVAGFDYTGYFLQSTTNLGSSAVWSTNSPGPVVVYGQNTVTNTISGTRKFFRLTQ